MKALFWIVLSFVMLVWASQQEQRVAIECMNGGHVWSPPRGLELSGDCLPGKLPRRIILPPMQVEPMPTITDPTPDPVPPL